MYLKYIGIFTIIAGVPLIGYFYHNKAKINYLLLIDAFQQVMYYKSIWDINFLKYKKKLLLFLENNKINFLKDSYDIEFIKDCECILHTTKEKCLSIINNDELEYYPDEADFVIYTEFDINKNIYNKKIILYKDFFTLSEKDFIMEESDVQFLLSEIVVNDARIKIDFKTDKENYYIINNKINKMVALYLLPRIKSSSITITSFDDFEISILDHIANEIELKDKELTIQKDSYNIK